MIRFYSSLNILLFSEQNSHIASIGVLAYLPVSTHEILTFASAFLNLKMYDVSLE